MHKYAVLPDRFRSEISFSRLWQHSKTLEKCENKEKLFELNVYFVRFLIRFYTYSIKSQSL